MLTNGFRDRTEDHPRLAQLSLKGCADRYAVKHRINSNPAFPFGSLDTRQKSLLFQRNSQFFIGFQKFRVDVIQGFWFFFHAFGPGIVILVLKVDCRIIDHGPIWLFQFQPPAVGRQAPIQHPFRFVVFG